MGAEPPAIKGLEPIEFNENDKAVELTFDFSESPSDTADTPEKTLFNKVVSALGSLLFNEQPPSEPATPPNPNPHPTSTPQKENAMTTPNPTPPINQAPAPAQATPPATPDPKDAEIANLKALLPQKNKQQHRQKLKQTNRQTTTLPKVLSKTANLCQQTKKWSWRC